MLCPNCKVALTIADRQGVEIDYCPQCRGVWLDRGELDKLIERASTFNAPQPNAVQNYAYNHKPDDDYYVPQQQPGYGNQYQPGYNQQYGQGYDPRYPYKKKKKESFLGEIFDFD